MNQTEIEQAARNFLTKRLENSAATTLGLFADNAVVRFPGAQDTSAISQSVQTSDALEELVNQLCSTWRWDSLDVESLHTGDHSAVVRYKLNAVHLPSGEALTTESMDEFHFNEAGQITHLVEFVDTAKAAHLESLAG